MITTEFYTERDDGVKLYRTYSTEGYYIERDGDLYEEAIDPEGSNRIYHETDRLIPVPPEPEEEIDGLEMIDKLNTDESVIET